MARVFVSHASEDIALACELYRWLVEAGHEVFLDRDLRDGIAVGEEWEQRLQERLRWANAMVCVVTSAYVASSWCLAEVSVARSRGSRLLPVQAEWGIAHALLKSIQHTDLTQDRVTARVALTEALRHVDELGNPDWPDGRSPFPGLRPFDVDWHRVFFGRAREVEQLAELLRSTAERTEGAVLLVIGPSGCGKSSLVRAGLLPVMVGEPGWWTLPPITPGADPRTTLARKLVDASRDIDLAWTVEHVYHQLDNGGLVGLADELLMAALGRRGQRLLIVVDQFEELLTQGDPADWTRFADLLRPALTGPVQVVATLRSEFLDQLLASPELTGLQMHTYVLRPLRHEALRAVIEQPARLAGIGVDERLMARLVDDTGSGDALPLLAFTLAELADGLSRGGQLSQSRYEELGGVQGALIREADAALADAVTAGGGGREEVIAALLRLVTVDEQGRPTRLRVRRDDEVPNSVVIAFDAFVARRLLTTDIDNGNTVIGVAHEAFLTTWPPLAKAITASASALRARRAVEYAATEWTQNGRPSARLWGGGQLAAAVVDTGARIQTALAPPKHGLSRWLPRGNHVLVTDRVDLSSQSRDFLHASIRHDRYRRTRASTILSILLVIALVAAGFAVLKQRAAEEQQQVATARQLVAQAEAARDTDPRTALMLGIAAQGIHPSSETGSSLVNTFINTRYAGTLTGPEFLRPGAFSPDWHTLVTTTEEKTVILWDITNLNRPTRRGPPLPGLTGPVASIAFSRDGHTLATAGYNYKNWHIDNVVTLWDVTDPNRPTRRGPPLTSLTGPVASMAFSPDGHTLATAGYENDNAVILWDITDPSRPTQRDPRLTGHTTSPSSVAFSPDGHTLATASSSSDRNDDKVILWDLTDPTRRGRPLTGYTNGVPFVAFSPDGHTLATASGEKIMDKTVILWDITDPNRPTRHGPPLTGHTDSVNSAAFSPDGRTLATASGDKTVILWDITDPNRPTRRDPPLAGHTGSVSSVAFSPDGYTLATGSANKTATLADKTVILWDLTDRRPILRNLPRTVGHLNVPPSTSGSVDIMYSAAFSPDGRTLATGSRDRAVTLWDITDRTRPTRLSSVLTEHSDSVYSVAFSPDGHTLATGSADKTVILWDITDPTRPTQLGVPLTGHTNWVYSVAFSPDGHTLATVSWDAPVIFWDITDRIRPTRLGLPLTRKTNSLTSVAFSPDGHTLATARSDKTVILWDITDSTRPTQLGVPLTGHTNWVYSVAFSPDGHTLATTANQDNDKPVILWDITDPTRPIRHDPPLTSLAQSVLSVAFSPNGQALATASNDNTVALWDVAAATPFTVRGLTQTGLISGLYLVAFSPDGRTLATASSDKTVLLWNITDPSQPTRHGPPLTGHTDHVNSVAFSPNGRTLATASSDKTVLLWDITDPSRPTRHGPPLTGHTDQVNSVTFSPDGRTLATASSDKTVLLWDITDPSRPTRPLTDHTHQVNSVAFFPNGHTVAASSGKTVILWDITNPIRPIQQGSPLTTTLGAFSPDGHIVAALDSNDNTDETTMYLWDITDPGRPIRRGPPLTGHTGQVYSISFSPDGRTLATASIDQTVILWDITDPDRPTQQGSPLTGRTGYRNPFEHSVAFSPDGHTLAASSDNTVILWDIANSTRPVQQGLPLTLTGHARDVASVRFSPDGHALVTTGPPIILWDLTGLNYLRDHITERACSLTGRGLNHDEWIRYIPGLEYRKTCPD